MPQQQPQLVNGLPQHISVTFQQSQLSALVQQQFHQLLQLDVPPEFLVHRLGQVAALVIAVIL